MRRLCSPRSADRALVAIYDALLFLMVVILISEGMFLYTATSSQREGSFDDSYYQHLADSGRIMVESLSLNDSHPMPQAEVSNRTGTEMVDLDQVADPAEAFTVRWLLESYSELKWRTEDEDVWVNMTYDTSSILPLVDEIFSENRLNGTNHAWLFLYNGQKELFGSNVASSLEDLPEDRWASSSDYSKVVFKGGNETAVYTAELRYFLWMV